ncbi:MAG: DUF423 domain-containing protein [Nodosilinea sp.]
MPLERIFLALAALLGGTAVVGGALATHALRNQLSERLLAIFETGSRYQMYHALALGLVSLALAFRLGPPALLVGAGWAFMIGTIIFSGSLYFLSLSGLNLLGAVAPVGGVILMVGWGCLALAAVLGGGESPLVK